MALSKRTYNANDAGRMIVEKLIVALIGTGFISLVFMLILLRGNTYKIFRYLKLTHKKP